MASLVGAVGSKLTLRQAVGVYVGEREVTLSRVALTPVGPVERESRVIPSEPEGLGEMLAEVLTPWVGRKGSRLRVALGLPAMRVYFSTRPVQSNDRDANATALLHEALRSSNVNVDEMEVDLIRSQPGKRALASLVACRRKYLGSLLEALKGSGVRPFRAEPAPFALLRLGVKLHPAPRRATLTVRVFLGPTQGVALLVQGTLPLAWRIFELRPGNEVAAVHSTAMALQIVGRHCGESGPPDAVIVHGRPDLTEAFESEPFREAFDDRVRHVPGPAFDGASVALGLALGTSDAEGSFDLSRTLKPRAPLREVIPWGEFAAQAALLACLTLLLDGPARELRGARRAVAAECARHPWMAKVADADLAKEKTELEQKIAAVRGYLGSRILWSGYTRDVATQLTDGMVVRSLAGRNDLEGGKGGGGAKKSLILKITAPVPRGQTIPQDIERYLDALRGDATLRRDFPLVELADLKWGEKGDRDTTQLAEFVVNCLPKVDKAPAPKAK